MPQSASDEIRAAIAAAGGALRFDRFMDLSLYGEHGFYTTGGSAGRRGDFLTSPEVGPLFGAVVARWVDAVWHDLHEPERFDLIEVGAGPGTLARSILASAPDCAGALHYTAVEHSESQRERHPATVESSASMPAGPVVGVVIANELLDNVPFRLLVNDGGWREAHVVDAGGSAFAEVLLAVDDEIGIALPAGAPHGARLPVQERAGRWVVEARSVLSRGRVLIVDYASPTTAALAARPWRDWLRTYRSHEHGVHYLREPGTQDITAEVALDQLFAVGGEPDAVRSQQQFLSLWGIDGLVEEGRRVWAEQSSRPTLDAMRMRSRAREAEALSDPAGLGAFHVIEYAARP